jgi:hypothetical protein
MLDDRPNLEGDQPAIHARPGLRELNCFVDVVRLEDRVAADDLLGLDERPIRDGRPADRLCL